MCSGWRKFVCWPAALVTLFGLSLEASGQQSQWVKTGATGRLIYVPDAQGDRILDFSNVGYQGRGNDLLPSDVPTVRTVSPIAGDDTANIQAAINQVAALPIGANGYRGAVLLNAGDYDIAGQLNINASGVVLRGVGREVGGSVLHARGTSQRSLVNVTGSGSQSLTGSTYSLVDKVVPAGANSFRLNSTAGLAVGQTVRVERPGTQAWVDAVGMGLPDGEDPAWQPSEFNIRHDRVITRIEGDRVFLDAPLATSFEQQYGGGTLRRYTWTGRIQNVGVENLRAESDYNAAEVSGSDLIDEDHSWTFVTVNQAQHVWVRNSLSKYFAYASVQADSGSKWVTVDNVVNEEPVSEVTGGRRYTFDLDGQMAYVANSTATKGRHDFVNNGAAGTVGPNVFHNSTATNARSDTGPHRRWSTATLFDNISVSGHQINVQNRGTAGTRHGWSGANMVVWNSTANSYRVQNPPTAQNWLVGSIGTNQTVSTPGYYDSHGTKVTAGGETSLYEAQMNDSADLKAFHWGGGSGNWTDALAWDEAASPGVYAMSLRDYLVGDIDNYTFDGGASVDAAYVNPAWAAAIGDASLAPVVGFDTFSGAQNMAFTVQHQLAANERVVHGFLALSMKQSGTSAGTDFVQLFDNSLAHRLSFTTLGWAGQVNASTPYVGVVDLGPYLDELQSGAVNVWLSDNAGVDWAIYTAAVATPKSDPVGAMVFLDGGSVMVSTVVAPIGGLQNGAEEAVSELVVGAAGRLEISQDFAQDPGSRLVVQIGGDVPGQWGTVAIGDEASLAGKLELELVSAFSPLVGTEFVVLTAVGGFGGTSFDAAIVGDRSGEGVWGLETTATTVIAELLSESMLGDLDGDGELTALDWTQFKSGQGANLGGLTLAQVYAMGDLNGDRLHDLADFVAFRAAYEQANGAGEFARMVQGVPEPHSLWLVVLTMTTIGRFPRGSD